MENEEIPDKCPHCGTKLSPWQKVLLSVDRAIMCKNCWYRIILEPTPQNKNKSQPKDSKEDEKRREDGNV